MNDFVSLLYRIARVLLLLLMGVGFAASLGAHEDFRVLVFSRTTGYRHASIEAGIGAIQNLGNENHFAVEATEDPAAFNPETLERFQAVIFLNTTGTVFDNEAQRSAFQEFIRSGKGFVGIHSAADTEYDWEWYGGLVGAYFKSHPPVVEAVVQVEDSGSLPTAHLPPQWRRTDEWYSFNTNPRERVQVLMSLDTESFSGGEMGADHPIAWAHDYDGGRALYTALGHTSESFSEEAFLLHILGAIRWAADWQEPPAPPEEGDFERTVLETNVTDPFYLAISADGRVFFVERAGKVRVWKPDTHSTTDVGSVPVSTDLEDGLLGLALDPGFAENGWLYLFYSPLGSDPIQRLSRFTVHGDWMDPASEEVLLEIPVQRDQCCHSSGAIVFSSDGNLYLSTGDNVNPFESRGYAPIDERPGRAAWDAQATSANARDLRGKILRIRPLPEGGYEIPEGNLFPPDGSEGAPEIYVMGARNPFRFSVDELTGWLYFGDVGPDAPVETEQFGPRGYDEINRTQGAGNFGWPYFVADNKAYRDYDFETGESGGWFDPNAPFNDSPNNTGPWELPPAHPAWIWFGYEASEEFPEIGEGEGRCVMAGPVYRGSADGRAAFAFPEYYDGAFFVHDWSRNWIKTVHMNEDGGIREIQPFMPGTDFQSPIHMQFGPDGRMYLIEWGEGFSGGNPDAQLVRIDYNPGGIPSPTAEGQAGPFAGPVPLHVEFSSVGSRGYGEDPENLAFAWDLDGDGQVDSMDPAPAYRYEEPGDYLARLTVMDEGGRSAVVTVPVFAGNSLPEIAIEAPEAGGPVDSGDWLDYRLVVTDAEDDWIDPERVTFQVLIGHNDHAHVVETLTGMSGRFQVPEKKEGKPGDDIFLVLAASYTDLGAPNVSALTGWDETFLSFRWDNPDEFHPADMDSNLHISSPEVTSYSGAWRRGETEDSSGVPAAGLVTRAGSLWRNGGYYRWDSEGSGAWQWVEVTEE